jgi:hypothetical protein
MRFGRRCEKPLFDQSRGLTDPALWSRDYLIPAFSSIAGPISWASGMIMRVKIANPIGEKPNGYCLCYYVAHSGFWRRYVRSIHSSAVNVKSRVWSSRLSLNSGKTQYVHYHGFVVRMLQSDCHISSASKTITTFPHHCPTAPAYDAL